MEECEIMFRSSLADKETGGLNLFRVTGAMLAPFDEEDGWHKSVTRTARLLAVIIREGVDRMREDDPSYVFRPRSAKDLMCMVHGQVTNRLGLDRPWLEPGELARALPAYLGLKDERRWWLSELRGFCSDSLEERLERIDKECGTDSGDDFLVSCHMSMLTHAWRMLAGIVFGFDTTTQYVDARSSTHTLIWRDDLTEALAKAERPL